MSASGLYAGDYRSAIARAKRIIEKAGLPWSRTNGRYHPFENQQQTSYGVRVTRIGCGDTVSLNVWGDYSMTADRRDARCDLRAQALAALRAAGLPFDDRGRLECGPRAACKLAQIGGGAA